MEPGTPISCILSGLCVYAAGVVCIVLGARQFWVALSHWKKLRRRPQFWDVTTGHILSSGVKIVPASEAVGPAYGLDVRYEYRVGERSYIGSRVGSREITGWIAEIDQMARSQYAPSQAVTVYYLLQNPEQSSLKCPFQETRLLDSYEAHMFLGIIFVFFGDILFRVALYLLVQLPYDLAHLD